MRTVEVGLHRRCVPLAIVACLAAALWAPPTMAQTLTDLGTLNPTGINADGQIVGWSYVAGGDYVGGDYHAFLSSNGVMTDLGTLLGGSCSGATGINGSGQIVGYSETASGDAHAFLYANGVMADLGTLGGHDNSGCGSGIFQFTNGEFVSYLGAYGINASGQVVGYSVTTDQSVHAFLYSDGVMTDLGALVGTTSEAYGINAGGQVVGNSDAADGYREHAFVCLGGVMSDLGALDGYFGDSFAAGINDSGQVVGWSTTANDLSDHAFLYSSGVMSDLGALPGGGWSEAYGINASGQVVGWSTTAVAYANHAFLYSNGVMIDLNSLLPANSDWELVYAQAINDSGQIVGLAIVNGSQYHGFLLTQAPNLTSLSPSSAAAGGAAFTLTVAGANFIPGVTVGWNGTALETSYVSGTQLTASVPASEIAITGTASVTVTTTAGTTGAATFAIHPPRRLGLPGEPERRRQPAPREQQ